MAFTSRELWTTMPCSNLDFQYVYRDLLDTTVDGLLPLRPTSQDDALVLLMAVVSDLLYLRRSIGQVVQMAASTNKPAPRENPHFPLSAHAELERMEFVLSHALDRWHLQFHTSAAPEIMAFYHYCRMYRSCDRLLDLPALAGHGEMNTPPATKVDLSVSGETIRQAWLVLDGASMRSHQHSRDPLCPIWLPIVVFHAGLVVWAEHGFGREQNSTAYRGAKILLPFKIELERMPWPCCREMVATLSRLAAKPTVTIDF
ncbi:hypothetical protein PV10_02209 [Exophiala mesophila]|uniref:Transcription factor domain-containing protein n=1 Tax=Exophiala mesophila TaxID=212818 RepID=A0A0D1ZIP8_EXOME|nr:uncharacterized protein PV10_02209 [Exophiala mesophila]KIV94442.1 hypothetical protein PV10_02209 [Exophiala mesophila]